MKKIFKIHLPRLVAIFVILVTSLTPWSQCWKMVSTSFQLSIISNEIEYIESKASTTPAGWDEDATADYQKQVEKRNALLNSSDGTVAKFAQASNAQKISLFLFQLIPAVILTFAGLMLITNGIKTFCKTWKKFCNEYDSEG